MTVALRDYQHTAVKNILSDWRDGFKRLLLMAATGTGKTIMFLAVAADILEREPTSRILILAHRRELIFQPIQRAQDLFPALSLRMGIVMASRDDVASQVIVATVQSLVSGSRLERILEHGSIDYLIIDECHHSVSDTYLGVLKALGNPFVLGCTATPKRSDRSALSEVFQKVSYRISIQDAIKQGALAPFTPLGFMLPADASRVKETKDGWQDEPMGDLLSAENILEILLNKWREYAANRQTIAFTASVSQAHVSAAYFREAGIPCAAVDGTTPAEERDQILRSYQKGELQVIFNCMVLTEGFDAPETGCVMMIAPTRSDLVYVQRLGRGLRTAPGKSDCLVLDFSPLGARDIVMAGDVLDGVPKQVKKQVQEAEDAGVLFGYQVTSDGIQAIDPHEVQAVVLNYLTHHRMAWTFDGKAATTALTKTAMLAILAPDVERISKADELRRAGKLSDRYRPLAEYIGKYRLYHLQREENQTWWASKLIGAWDSMTGAKEAAEEISRQYEDTHLGEKNQSWRDSKPMSEKQAAFLRKLGGYQPGLTCGQAAQRITHLIATRTVSRSETYKQQELMR